MSPDTRSWVPTLEDQRTISRLWWLVGIVLAAGILVFLVRGADRPADPFVRGASDTTLAPAPIGGRIPLPGFDEVAVSITDGASSLDRCLLLAGTEAQRQRGLMTVTDPTLGGYDGMLFRFDQDVQAGFYMRNTPMPLSIAWLDANGKLVSNLDMEPCGDVDGCTVYNATAPYRFAVEVPTGRLGRLGITASSVLAIRPGACTPRGG